MVLRVQVMVLMVQGTGTVEKLLTGEGQLVTPALPCHGDLVCAQWKDSQDHLTTY